MPVSKRILLTLLITISGVVGFYVEQQAGAEILSKAMIALTVMMIISLWSLAPVSRDDSDIKVPDQGRKP